jgi:hypothetical protein
MSCPTSTKIEDVIRELANIGDTNGEPKDPRVRVEQVGCDALEPRSGPLRLCFCRYTNRGDV